MPENLLILMDLIKEQLFYNAEGIVVLDQLIWEENGLTEMDVEQGLRFLREKGAVTKVASYTGPQNGVSHR